MHFKQTRQRTNEVEKEVSDNLRSLSDKYRGIVFQFSPNKDFSFREKTYIKTRKHRSVPPYSLSAHFAVVGDFSLIHRNGV